MPDLPVAGGVFPGPNNHVNPIQQTAQHLAVGNLHEQGQTDHIVDDVRRQLTLPLARLTLGNQHRFHLIQRKRPGQHAEINVIGNPCTFPKFCDGSGHLRPSSLKLMREECRKLSSEQY